MTSYGNFLRSRYYARLGYGYVRFVRACTWPCVTSAKNNSSEVLCVLCATMYGTSLRMWSGWEYDDGVCYTGRVGDREVLTAGFNSAEGTRLR